ncbi:hypothetical protein MJO47_10330 [Desulfuromonas sp. KJ2020]|uniref:hypothetical protein n=1 Tax=Desulfuromonas sp. KJ2020 TaxID=2919173 RepID=UPI0020A74BAA|nr:hypothetical protein [Desulfuromonas sp. KJ2020]MCP3177497.1 hypothetical protein [Desulfuromonas sp. KJ2020]
MQDIDNPIFKSDHNIYIWGKLPKCDDLDVCVVSINRPDLLEVTLESFSRNLLSQWPNKRLIINVDPVPTSPDSEKFLSICKKYFNNGIIRFSKKGNFSNAVKWSWSNSCTNYIFNLEDDWICLANIKKNDVENTLKVNNLIQIKLPKRHQFKVLNSGFSLNPCFINGDWARKTSALLDSNYDPEKQIRHLIPDVILSAQNAYKFHQFVSKSKLPVIYDTGTYWKKIKGIQKTMDVDHQVSWNSRKGFKYLNECNYILILSKFKYFSLVLRISLGVVQLFLDKYRSLKS